MSSVSKTEIFRKDYQQPNYWVKSVNLGFIIEPEMTLVKSKIRFYKNPNTNGMELILNGNELELQSIKLNGLELSTDDYFLSDDALTINNPPQDFELSIENRIYPAKNTALEGLYQSGDFFLTQCEAEGFRKITYYPDRPDVMAPFDVTMIADKTQYPVLLSNGNETSHGELKNNKHYVRYSDPHPKPSYLFALVAGQLECIQDEYTTINNDKVKLRIFVEKENIKFCDFAMESLINSMRWDEKRFGLAYDLSEYNIVATNDFNMGAMENKGLNIFNSKYVLADKETATDSDFIGIEAVIGHEYFHNWTGNRVTCQDWFQLSLKEGLTVFRDQEFTSDMQSRAVKRIEDVRYLRAAQFAEDAGPMSHPVRPDSFVEINNFYTLTIYEKGAQVVGMYRTLFGDEGFRKGMDLYFKRHDGQAVTCDDFRAAMADANNKNLDQFELWYLQNGTPRIEIKEKYNAESKVYQLKIKQKAPKNINKSSWKPMHIPMRLALFNSQGESIALDEKGTKESIIELTDKKTTLEFNNLDSKPIASVFRDFSAPVSVKFKREDKELLSLMRFDTDPFNRWDSAQQISKKIILDAYQAELKKQDKVCPEYFIQAIENILLDQDSDPALLAEALNLPGLKSLMTELSDINVQCLAAARSFVKNTLAERLEIEFLSIYNQNYIDGDYKVKSKDIAKRSLKNTCLSYLMTLNNPDCIRLCEQQYQNSNNMTDSIAALKLLVHHSEVKSDGSIDEFAKKWSDNALVMDKWFIIQATSPQNTTLNNVKKLMGHENFNIKNPNKVRSLIGAFASGNPTQFHNPDGSGYQFLADMVIELNQLNPQVASRMASLFNNWKQMSKLNQEQIKPQLKRISEENDLSSDVSEIVNKALET